MQSATAIARKGASTYNRFGGSGDTPRGRAVTISISSTTKVKESRQNQTKAKDDNAIRSTTSPQSVSDAERKSTPTIMSPELSTASSDSPVVSPPLGGSTSDGPDVAIKRTGQPASNKQPSSTKPSNEKPEFQGFKLRKTGLSVNDKCRSNKSKVHQLSHMIC